MSCVGETVLAFGWGEVIQGASDRLPEIIGGDAVLM
jgi:hypothetical protein